MQLYSRLRPLLWAAVLGACSEGASDPPADCARLRAACDVSQPKCQRAVFLATACLREQDDAEMPAVRTISEAELRAESEQAYEDSPPTDTAWLDSLSLFDLVPRGRTFAESDVDDTVSFVAAHYSSRDKRVTLVREKLSNDLWDQTILLAHEFVHALQDQRDGLQALTDTFGDSSDARDALSALTEGEARVLSYTLLARFAGGEAQDLRWDRAFESELNFRLDELAESEAPLLSAWHLAYPLGQRAVADAYLEAGIPGISALFAAPPRSALAWTLPADEREEPAALSCKAPEAPDGYTLSTVEQQGMLGLLALYAASGHGAMYDEAQAWSADAYAVYTASDQGSRDLAVAWRIRFKTSAAAADFVGTLDGAFTPRQMDDEVVLAAASTPSVLDAWAFDTCAAQPAQARAP